jgi:Tol biopolymer transport system component
MYVGELDNEGTRLDSPTRLSESDSYDYVSAWTRDSKSVLFSSNRTGKQEIFQQRLGQDTAEPLIQDLAGGNAVGPEMSPDGRWILYWLTSSVRAATNTTTVMRFPVAGGSPEKIFESQPDSTTYFHCPSRPGSCVVSRGEKHGQLIFYALDPDRGQGKELARTKLGSLGYSWWSISPDGLRIAILEADQVREQVRVLDLRNGKERNPPLAHGWRFGHPNWAADSSALFENVRSKSTGYMIIRIELDGKTRVLLDRGRNQWVGYPCPSPDGHHLAFSQQTFETNAWLLENF